MDILLEISPESRADSILERRSASLDRSGGKMNRKKMESPKEFSLQEKLRLRKELRLQRELRLTDEDIEQMRDLEATWNPETEEFIPSTLPLVELIRCTLGISIGLTKPSQNC
jgi:hypothetical protein